MNKWGIYLIHVEIISVQIMHYHYCVKLNHDFNSSKALKTMLNTE